MTITPEQLAMMREDAAAARTNAEAARSLDESDAMAFACVGAEVAAGHVERLVAEVERLSTLEAIARKHHATCLGTCGCSICDWVVASRKAAPDAGEPCPGSRGW